MRKIRTLLALCLILIGVTSAMAAGERSFKGFTIVGQTSNSKGSVTVGGTTYNECVKMGSSSSVTFSIAQPMNLTLYFASSASKRIKINEMPEITIPDNNTVTTTLPAAGEYTIKRTSSESYLYYIALSPIATGIEAVISSQFTIHNSQSLYSQPSALNFYNLSGQRVSGDYRGIVVVGGKKVMR